MEIEETLKILDAQAEGLKMHRDIDVPKKIDELEEITESNFEEFLKKVTSKDYTVIVFSQGDIYDIFNFIAPSTQKQIKSIIQYAPYAASILATIYGLSTENYVLAASLIIPFIAGFITGFLKTGLVTVLILVSLIIYFYANANTVGVIFMIVWTVSILLSRFLRFYIQQTLLNLALSSERIFVFLYYSRLLRILDTKNDRLMYSK